MTTRWLDPMEDRAWRGLRRVATVPMAAIGSDLTADTGLSDADYEVLSMVSEAPSPFMRFRDLAAATRWSTSRLSHHLTRMEKRGLIARRGAEGDARGAEVSLTEAGVACIKTAAPHHVDSVRRHVFDRLTREQIEQLAQITEALLTVDDARHN